MDSGGELSTAQGDGVGLLQFISGMSSCSPQPKATAWVCCSSLVE